MYPHALVQLRAYAIACEIFHLVVSARVRMNECSYSRAAARGSARASAGRRFSSART